MNNLRQVMKVEGTANAAAASAASAAEVQAARNGVPLQALSIAFLNVQLPVVTWVGASTEAPYTPSGKRIVGISLQGGHVMTAVQPFQGQCNFGLVVTSGSDPIIVMDHLGGPGTFGSKRRVSHSPLWCRISTEQLAARQATTPLIPCSTPTVIEWVPQFKVRHLRFGDVSPPGNRQAVWRATHG